MPGPPDWTMGLPLLQAREPEFGLVLLWLLFILIPIVGRIVGSILRRLAPGGSASADPRPAREERQRRAREIQQQGEELFRRLLGGEEPEAEREATGPPAAPAAPRPPAPARRTTRPEPRRPQIAEPLRRAPTTLPSEERLPSRLEVLPSSVAADALADDLGDDLVGLDTDLTALGEDLASGDFVSSRSSQGGEAAFALSGRADLVRAIVWSEVLGPPVSLREPRLPGGG